MLSGTSGPRRRAHPQLAERADVLLVLRQQLHHDPVLVRRRVDRRHLPLAERVVQRVLDLARRHAELARRLAIDVDRDLRILDQQVARDVDQARATAAGASPAARAAVFSAVMSPLCSVYWYRLFDARPPIEIAGGFWMNVRDAGDARHRLREVARDLVGAAIPLVDRLEVDRELALVRRRRGADGRRHRPHVRILRDRRRDFLLVLAPARRTRRLRPLRSSRAAGRCRRSGRVPWASTRRGSPSR